MIRKFQPDDADSLVAVWEDASAVAHPFLDRTFLTREKTELRTQHLRNAETWVFEHDDRPGGFVSLIRDQIGGLFVQPVLHGRGFGRALVDHAVDSGGRLRVDVFAKNRIGRRFYERYGFVETGRYHHEASSEVMLQLALPEVLARRART